jgi:hypothetical protein
MNTFKTNKYGIPSYYQFSGMLDFRFKEFLQGLNLQLLVINKKPKNGDLPDQLRINRVDMWNLNLVMDYRF